MNRTILYSEELEPLPPGTPTTFKNHLDAACSQAQEIKDIARGPNSRVPVWFEFNGWIVSIQRKDPSDRLTLSPPQITDYPTVGRRPQDQNLP